MTVPRFLVSDFVKRQTHRSEFSHFSGKWDEVLDRTISDWDKRVKGYRDGVFLVPISNVDGFFTSTCILRDGDQLQGTYKPRVAGEQPRKSVGVVKGKKIPAKRVDIVLYHRDVLAESKENTPIFKDKNTFFFGQHQNPFAEWEIISVNCSATDDAEPMSAGTLMANHFHVAGSNDGGTTTGLSDAEFIAKLRESFVYWKDKAKIAV